MADSITKPFALYRLTNTGDTETTIPNDESIGLEYGMIDTANKGVVSFDWKIPNRITDVPSPDARSNSAPDTGVGKPTVIIGIKFDEKVADDNYGGILTKWALEEQTNEDFQKGRFGLRNNNKPWMNFLPTATAGYKIMLNDSGDKLEFGGLFDVIITLEFAGATSELVNTINGELS